VVRSGPRLGPFSSYAALVRRARGFRLLLFATLTSSAGTLLAVIALVIDVKERTESGIWVSALLIVEFVPIVAIGLFLGPLVDRLSRRRLMIASDLLRFGVFCLLPFAPNALAIVVLAGVAGFSTAFFRPAVYAGLPNVVDEEDLPAANSVMQGVENAMWALAPVTGGALAAAFGTGPVYWITAATFLLSATIVSRIPARLLQKAAAISKGHWRDVADGISLVLGSRALLVVLVAWSVAMLGNAAINVSEIFMAQDVHGAGSFGFGLLFGSIGVGLAVGSALASPLIARTSVTGVYAGALGIMCVAYAAAGLAPSIWVTAALASVGGVGNGLALVCNALLVQRGAPDHLRGRVFTVIMSANFVVLGVGMALAGPLVDALGARVLWVGAAGVFGTAAAIAFLLTRSISVTATVDQPPPVSAVPTSAPAAGTSSGEVPG
jgi:MFS family permease